MAIHFLDLLRYWFEDDFVEVTALGRTDPPMKNGAESTCVALLKTRRGMLGTLNWSYTVARTPYSQRSLLLGTRGTLAQHMEKIGGGYAGEYYISTNGGQPSPQWGMMYSGFERVAERVAREFPDPPPSSFTTQILACAECVRSRKAGENSLHRNLNTIATIDAIGRAIETGTTQEIQKEIQSRLTFF